MGRLTDTSHRIKNARHCLAFFYLGVDSALVQVVGFET